MWTRLRSTVEAGARTIAVLGEIDWQVGDEIIVSSTAPSQYRPWMKPKKGLTADGDDVSRVAGTKRIRALNGDGWDTEILLQTPLASSHVSAIEYHNGIKLDMRCEVGLFDSFPQSQGGSDAYRFNIIFDSTWLQHWDFVRNGISTHAPCPVRA